MDNALDDYLASVREKANRIQEQTKFYADLGWIIVTIPDNLKDIGPWIQENIKNDWRAFPHMWLFEDENDATLFKLRWL